MKRTSKVYSVYLVTAPDGKQYIGCTVKSLRARWTIHVAYSKTADYPISQAIRKYGGENFTIQLLKEFITDNEAKHYETLQIKQRRTWHPFGLNATITGQPKGWTEHSRNKSRVSHTGKNNIMWGKHHTIKTRKKISSALSGENNPRYGIPLPLEQKESLRQANLGSKHTEKSKRKMRLAKLGKKLSKEHKINMSLAQKRRRAREKAKTV